VVMLARDLLEARRNLSKEQEGCPGTPARPDGISKNGGAPPVDGSGCWRGAAGGIAPVAPAGCCRSRGPSRPPRDPGRSAILVGQHRETGFRAGAVLHASVMEKVVPLPGLLVTVIVPPLCSTNPCTVASPRPVHPRPLRVEKNGPNTRSSVARSSPHPVSGISSRPSPPTWRPSRSRRDPPSGIASTVSCLSSSNAVST
jgi:hypothetical protein